MANPVLLILGVGAAALLLGGKKKAKTAKCPKDIVFDLGKIEAETIMVDVVEHGGEGMEIMTPKLIANEVRNGNRDFVGITKRFLATQLPKHCLDNPNVMVELRHPEDLKPVSYIAPAVVFFVAADAAEDFYSAKLISDEEYERAKAAIVTYWSTVMPNTPFPED